MSPIAVLVGAPGAGKSTVGRRIAGKLGVDFADSDALVEVRAGKPVADIFVSDGEVAFRDLERTEIAEALVNFDGVLSLGGGAVLDDSTRAALLDQRVIWLQVDLTNATQRVGMNSARPLLLGNVRGTMLAMLDARTPLYEEVADHRIDTSGRSIKEVVAEAVAIVEEADER
jgi:shikimate kinase